MIHGVARTLTPLMIADPTDDARTSLSGRVSFGGSTGLPITLTRQMPLHYNGQRYPIVPGNTVRGALRRACADVVEERLAERGLSLSLPVYQAMRCGAASGKPERGRAISLANERALRNNIFAGLFGGGPRLQDSRIVTDNWVPIASATIEAGMVDGRFADQVGAGDDNPARMLNVQFVRRRDDVLEFTDPNASDVITVYPDAVDQWQQIFAQPKTANVESASDPAESDNESAADARGVAGFNAHQVVVPTVAFFTRIDARPSTDAQAGLLLDGLARLLNTQLGSHKRCGYGRFSYQLELTIGDERIEPYVVGEDGRYTPNRGYATVARMLDAADAELEAFDVRDFEAIYGSNPKIQQELRKKANIAEESAAW